MGLDSIADFEPPHVLLTAVIWVFCQLILFMFITDEVRKVLPFHIRVIVSILALPIIWVIIKMMSD